MKRVVMAGVIAAVLGMANATFAAAPEPVGISLLRIEMKRTLLQQDISAKMTQLRQRKLQELQAAGKPDEAADAEVDLIQAQTNEAITGINAKELDLQLKEALKATSAPPPPQNTPPAPGAPAAPGNPAQPAAEPSEPVASPTEISMLQFELQKARLQANAAAKIADNRQKVLTTRQSQGDKGASVQLTDAEAEVVSAQASARMAQLDVEAAQLRLDAAVKSTKQNP